jgi:hypothetical protein
MAFVQDSEIATATQWERLFRIAAGLDIDRSELPHHTAFIHQKIYDLLLRGEATAKANGRYVIQTFDLPLTRGLQESIQAFRKLDEGIERESLLAELARRPPLDLVCSPDVEALLPEIAGALSVALAHTFRILEPKLRHPLAIHWERAHDVFDLLI